MKKNVVFVCTGNTCRSPMAEALFYDMIRDNGMEGEFAVHSRGIYAFNGDPANRQAIEVMKKEFSIDLRPHRARFLDGQDIDHAHIILTMTGDHKRMILDVYPEAESKVFVMKDFASIEGDLDIPDPFGGDYETYKASAFEIEEILLEVLQNLQ